MIMWNGYSHDKKIPVTISVEYDEDLAAYIVEVKRGVDIRIESFEPTHEPKDKLMHIIDVEKSVKMANNILKDMKREARRK